MRWLVLGLLVAYCVGVVCIVAAQDRAGEYDNAPIPTPEPTLVADPTPAWDCYATGHYPWYLCREVYPTP